MNTPTRRDLFRLGLNGAGLVGLSRLANISALAQFSPNYKALVCIFLFGGNDSNNMVVPLATPQFDAYTRLRQALALPSAGLLPVTTGNNVGYGLHPKLTGLQRIFNNRQLAVVANVGTLVRPTTRTQMQQKAVPVPSNLFSHSDQQLQWQSDVTSGPITTGWAGRAADLVGYMNSPSTFPTFVSVAGNTLMGNGVQSRQASVIPGAALGLTGFDKSAAGIARLTSFQAITAMNGGPLLVQAGRQVVNAGIKDADTLTRVFTGTSPVATPFPTTNIGQQLGQVAKLIQMRREMEMNRQIFFCSLGGFDTHSSQLTAQDSLFTQLNDALSAFHTATQELGIAESITTFTESDFSRTFQPNSNGGTDHAWGGHHIVMGGAVRGGNVYGQFPEFALNGPNDSGGEGRWIPTTSLDQYGATLAQWFGVAPADLPRVFPNVGNFAQQNLGFLG